MKKPDIVKVRYDGDVHLVMDAHRRDVREYAVYRDGRYIGRTKDNIYIDGDISVGNVYAYFVRINGDKAYQSDPVEVEVSNKGARVTPCIFSYEL